MAVRRNVKEETTSDEMIQVAVLRAGSKIVRVDLEPGSSVADAIEEAGFTVKERDEVTVNGDAYSSDELDEVEVEDADKVVITQKFAGGR